MPPYVPNLLAKNNNKFQEKQETVDKLDPCLLWAKS
jgi:hypothetical protein